MSQVALILHLRRARVALMDARDMIERYGREPLGELAVELSADLVAAIEAVDIAGLRLREWQSERMRRVRAELGLSEDDLVDIAVSRRLPNQPGSPPGR